MTSFKIFTAGQFTQVLCRSEGDRFDSARHARVATIRNTKFGWFAKKDSDDAAQGVNVSRLINDHNGPARIAEILGLD